MNKRDRTLIALEVQLYLADRYGLSETDAAMVFAEALADSAAPALASASTIDDALEPLIEYVESCAYFRVVNPRTLGLRATIHEFKTRREYA